MSLVIFICLGNISIPGLGVSINAWTTWVKKHVWTFVGTQNKMDEEFSWQSNCSHSNKVEVETYTTIEGS